MTIRRETQKVAQCSFGPVNGPVHCIAEIWCVCILFCMSDLHHIHCTCPSPHKWIRTENYFSYQHHWQIITWMRICDLLCNNRYFMTNPIHMIYQKPATCQYFLFTSMVCKYILTHDAWKQKIQVMAWGGHGQWGSLPWCGMMCATLKALAWCNVPITMPRRHMVKDTALPF